MKKFKIISLIMGICTALNITAAAVKPELKSNLQDTIILGAQKPTKNITVSLTLFGSFFDSLGSKFEYDSIMCIAQHLIYYVYTLYPRSVTETEKNQLSSFFEKYSNKYGFPQYLECDFYSALDNIPNTYDKSEADKLITICYAQLSDSEHINCRNFCDLIKVFTAAVYTLYTLPLSDIDRLMIDRTFERFKLLKPSATDLDALKNAIDNLPKRNK